jgi:hypothetical protein
MIWRVQGCAAAALILCCLGSVPAAAQTPKPAAGGAPAFAKTAKIDAGARKALEQMASAYRALSSYSGTIEVAGTGLPNMPSQRSTIAFKRPNRAAVVTTNQGGVVQTVTDGTHFYAASTTEKGRYLKVKLPADAQPIPLVIQQGGAGGYGLMPLLIAGSIRSRRSPKRSSPCRGARRTPWPACPWKRWSRSSTAAKAATRPRSPTRSGGTTTCCAG